MASTSDPAAPRRAAPRRRRRSEVADLALAGAGEARIDWADAQMPVVAGIRRRFAVERPLVGLKVAACLHVTAETGALVRTLAAGGAEIALAAANPLSTQDEVAAALAVGPGVDVHARRGEAREAQEAHVAAVATGRPHLTMDDGGDVLGLLHRRGARALGELRGGTEETGTGALRLRALHERRGLAAPVIAVNEARTHTVVENRHGTGQSALDGILRATNVLLAGRTLVVLGYGSCGRGVADRARGMGAQVIVCEVDPLRALEAQLAGFRVMTALEAAALGDVFVTVTGNREVLRGEHLERMRDGAILANAGHFDVEVRIADLEALTEEPPVEVRPLVERYVIGGRRLHLLARGRVVNLAAAEGYPASVLDLSFANQALAIEALATQPGRWAPGVHPVPPEMDAELARLKLESLGIRIDALTEDQRDYVRSWG